MRKIIQQSETLRLYLTYIDIDTGDPLDPSAIICTIKQPDATIVTITYPHTNFVRTALGSFYIRATGTQVGTHSYRIVATIGPDSDIKEGKFDVEAQYS